MARRLPEHAAPRRADAPAGDRSRWRRAPKSTGAEGTEAESDLAPGRLVSGIQAVREAIRAHRNGVRHLLIEASSSATLEALARFAADQGVTDVRHVPRAALDRLTRGAQHQGVLAVAPELSLLPLSELLSDPALIAVALDGVQDPQNFGAVIRSAVAVSRAAVLWAEHSSAPLSAATFRASAGAVEHARLCRVPSLVGALAQARDAGVSVIGLDAHASQALADLAPRSPLILVIGAEHSGMSRGVRRVCTALARLPLSGPIDSLNASVAAAIGLYEISNSNKN